MKMAFCLFPVKRQKMENWGRQDNLKLHMKDAFAVMNYQLCCVPVSLIQWDYLKSRLMLKDEDPSCKPGLPLKSDVLIPGKYDYIWLMEAMRLTWTDGDDLKLLDAASSI